MKLFFQRYFSLLDDQAKKQLPLLIFIFISISLLDVIGIGLVSGFLLLAVNFDGVFHRLPIYFQQLFTHYSKQELVFFIGISLVICFFIKGVWSLYAQRKIMLFTAELSVRLKMRLMAGYQNAAYLFHINRNSGYLLNKVNLVDGFSNNVASASLNLGSCILIVLAIVTYLFVTHPWITLFLILMNLVIVAFYELFIKKHLIKIGKILTISGGEINKAVLHALGGLKEIRVLGRETFFLNKIRCVVTDYSRAVAAFNAFQSIPRYAVEAAASIFLVVLVLGALFVGVSPLKMVPTIGVFAAACIRLLPSINQLIALFSQLRSKGYYVTIMLSEEFEKLDHQYHVDLIHDKKENNLFYFYDCALQHVSFQYPNAKQNAITDANLFFSRGQSIGLVGTSGAGKSTLMGIILGLLVPVSGKLLVNGEPIKNLRAWLNNFAYIPQTIFLLDDTLKRNIAMGTEDEDIDSQRLNDAIEMAQLSRVISDLPDGIDTLIGENGVRLSGGQRQRVALARAFYYKREIIIMDEATSALDNETEREVLDAIKQLHGIRTLIVIAHRLTTIQYCDVVYKLEQGRIVAVGSFNEVIGIA